MPESQWQIFNIVTDTKFGEVYLARQKISLIRFYDVFINKITTPMYFDK